MNRPSRRLLHMALAALPLIGGAVSFALGLRMLQWVALVVLAGSVLLTAVLGHVFNTVVGGRARATRAQGRPWLLAVLAAGLPDLWAVQWAEEMHAQLLELRPCRRRKVLWNLVTRAPAVWTGTWRAHWQHTRLRRYRGDNLLLVARLDMALRAPGTSQYLHGRFVTLHAVGMSRARACQPIHQVPALVLARRLLSTRGSELAQARDRARRLLAVREEAHLITRGLRRLPALSWPREPDSPFEQQYERLADLRDTAQQQVKRLRQDLRSFVDQDRSVTDKSHQ